MLRCRGGSYYVGHTDDLERRLNDHYHGAVPGYTKSRRPLTLVWSAETETRYEALTFEFQIKRWSRAKKEALIENDWDLLSFLAQRRTPQGATAQSEALGPNPVRPEALEGRTVRMADQLSVETDEQA
ncbi:MAG TPA: GIY-YIG nuclease family protein [Dehalococcoidia bacterium]|nr:GIY-YIG nuclease family protein [Dehalococcoidia bacterium]